MTSSADGAQMETAGVEQAMSRMDTAGQGAVTAWSSAATTIGSLEGQLGRGVLGQAFMGRYRVGAEQVARDVSRHVPASERLAGAGLASTADYVQADTTGRDRFEGLA
ncbi:hypothetical protein ABTZ99_40105 [Actinosynnema sp. NPDC002837]